VHIPDPRHICRVLRPGPALLDPEGLASRWTACLASDRETAGGLALLFFSGRWIGKSRV